MQLDTKRAASPQPRPSSFSSTQPLQQQQPASSPSSSSSSLPKLRLVVLFSVWLGLLMLVPLAHLLLSSSLTSAFCQPSVISAQAASSMKSLLLSDHAVAARSLSPLSSSSAYYAFSFPRPTPYVFVTSHPDPSASLSQQYSQWLYGPYLALTLNISYAYTPLLKLSSRWNGFLGAGHGETAETELQAEFGRTRYFQRSFDEPAAEDDAAAGTGNAGGSGGGAVVEDWIRSRRKKVDHLNHQIAVHAKRALIVPDLPPLELEEPKGSHIDGYNTRHLNPAEPVSTVTVFRLYRIGLPALPQACLPALHLLMRQKYCAARVRQPLPVDLYADARRAGQMIVAVHILCGEQCWNPDKTTPISVFINALHSIAAIAANSSLPSPSFHVFSSLPVNASWSPERYLSPLTAAFPRLQLHLDLHSHLVFHHLVMSDVLLPPPLGSSSTSWLVQLLHAGVVIGSPVPVHACQGEVDGWRKETGHFESRSFIMEWLRMQKRRQRFDSLQDCQQMLQLPPR